MASQTKKQHTKHAKSTQHTGFMYSYSMQYDGKNKKVAELKLAFGDNHTIEKGEYLESINNKITRKKAIKNVKDLEKINVLRVK